MSRLDPLLDALNKTGAEELRLVSGERIHLVTNGQRQDIGREPVHAATINQLAASVLGADDLLAAHAQPMTTRIENGGKSYDVVVAPGAGAGVAVAIRPIAGMKVDTAQITAKVPRYAGPPVAAVAPPLDRDDEPPQSFSAVIGRSGSSALDALLRDAATRRASDLHLSTGAHPIMRIDGTIHFMTDRPPLSARDLLSLVGPIQSESVADDFQRKRDVDFAYEIPSLGRFRVNLFFDRKGPGAVFRHIPSEVLPLNQLGLTPQALDLCNLTKGLVLVTGPTGSGKSTTIAAMIDHINRSRGDHIITIEDPIEFLHENQRCLVNQREVGRDTLGFKEALRAALREDPDVILVGEMRDLETISIAIETAETGHLVFGTLHTTTAMSTVDRVIDQFPANRQSQVRVMLADALKGVVAQVLCRKQGGGRVPAMEILLATPALSALIREGKTFQIQSIMQTSKQAGMCTMNDSLMSLVQRKLVTTQEAWLRSTDKNGLATALKTAGLPLPF